VLDDGMQSVVLPKSHQINRQNSDLILLSELLMC
jgi:hypothetical protein